MQNLALKYPAITAALELSLFEDFATDLDEFGVFESDNIETIESQSRDGFIPFTNGGRRAMVLQILNYHYNATGREADIIAPYVTSAENDAASEFVRHRSEDTDGPGPELSKALAEYEETGTGSRDVATFVYDWFYDREQQHDDATQADFFGDKPAFWSTPCGTLREEFQQYSDERLSEGGDYWLCANALFYASDNRRNVTGSDEIYFFAGVNTDFTYGRDKGIVSTFERTYKVERLTPGRIRVIVAAMQASISETSS